AVTNFERAEVQSISRAEFGNSLIEVVCDPYVLTLTGNAEGSSADSVFPQYCSREAQLGNRVAEVVDHKYCAPNNSYTQRSVSDGKRPEIRARGRHFCNTVAFTVRDPEVRAV